MANNGASSSGAKKDTSKAGGDSTGKRPMAEGTPIPAMRTKTLAKRSKVAREVLGDSSGEDSQETLDLGTNPPPKRAPRPKKLENTVAMNNLPHESDIQTIDDALLLLRQWEGLGFLTGLPGRNAIAGFPELWKAWVQSPKFPPDFRIHPLSRDVAISACRMQLAKTAGDIARATPEITADGLISYQRKLLDLRRYQFNTHIAEMALESLMAQAIKKHAEHQPAAINSEALQADLVKYEKELEILKKQLDGIQAQFESKKKQADDTRELLASASVHKTELNKLEKAVQRFT